MADLGEVAYIDPEAEGEIYPVETVDPLYWRSGGGHVYLVGQVVP